MFPVHAQISFCCKEQQMWYSTNVCNSVFALRFCLEGCMRSKIWCNISNQTQVTRYHALSGKDLGLLYKEGMSLKCLKVITVVEINILHCTWWKAYYLYLTEFHYYNWEEDVAQKMILKSRYALVLWGILWVTSSAAYQNGTRTKQTLTPGFHHQRSLPGTGLEVRNAEIKQQAESWTIH